MVLWSILRLSRFKFRALSSDFRRFYNLNPAPVLSSRKLVPILNYPKFIVQDEQLVLFRKVRFYAKPLKKKAEKDASEPMMNEEITAPTVRLVVDEENHIIVSRHEALARARSLKLDLVEVDKSGKPPVCKIFDYNKQKYVQQTKEKERTKSKSTTLKPGAAKEIRFGFKIKQNDLKIKADMAKRLMEKGYRVKCTAADGAEGVDLKSLLSKFTPLIDDVAVVESGPKYEKKQAYVVVRHVKFGPVNKSSGKKASASADSPQTKEDSDEDARTYRSDWAAFDGEDGEANPIFEMDNEENGQLERPKHTASSIPSGIPKPATETPRPAYPPGIPMAMNGRGATNTINRVPRPPNQENQMHFGMNTPPRTRPGRQVEAPACGTPNQTSSSSTDQNSPPKSYGIFSAPKINAAAAANRYQQNVPSATAVASSLARNPRMTAAPSPAADSRMNRGVGADNSGQGRYGIFSAEEREKQAQKR